MLLKSFFFLKKNTVFYSSIVKTVLCNNWKKLKFVNHVWSLLNSSYIFLQSFYDRAKIGVEKLVERVGFLGILACASVSIFLRILEFTILIFEEVYFVSKISSLLISDIYIYIYEIVKDVLQFRFNNKIIVCCPKLNSIGKHFNLFLFKNYSLILLILHKYHYWNWLFLYFIFDTLLKKCINSNIASL